MRKFVISAVLFVLCAVLAFGGAVAFVKGFAVRAEIPPNVIEPDEPEYQSISQYELTAEMFRDPDCPIKMTATVYLDTIKTYGNGTTSFTLFAENSSRVFDFSVLHIPPMYFVTIGGQMYEIASGNTDGQIDILIEKSGTTYLYSTTGRVSCSGTFSGANIAEVSFWNVWDNPNRDIVFDCSFTPKFVYITVFNNYVAELDPVEIVALYGETVDLSPHPYETATHVFSHWREMSGETILFPLVATRDLVVFAIYNVYYRYIWQNEDGVEIKRVTGFSYIDIENQEPPFPDKVGFSSPMWVEIDNYPYTIVYRLEYWVKNAKIEWVDDNGAVIFWRYDYEQNTKPVPYDVIHKYDGLNWRWSHIEEQIEYFDHDNRRVYRNVPFFEISVSYYTVERLYYSKAKGFWFIRELNILGWHVLGDEYVYADFIIYRTDKVFVRACEEPNFDEILGVELYDIPRYKNLYGFDFVSWENGAGGIPKHDKLKYTAQYDVPNITVEYYGSNGAYVETRYISPKFVPIVEIANNMNALEGFEKYFADIVLKFDFVEFVDDVSSRADVKEYIKYLKNRYVFGLYEVLFMTAQPDVNIPSMFGIFKSGSAAVTGATFRYMLGTSSNNNYVYWADLSMMYVTGLRYDLRVTFDTPYDRVLDVGKNILNGVKGINFKALGWVVLAVVLFVMFFPVIFAVVGAVVGGLVGLVKLVTRLIARVFRR